MSDLLLSYEEGGAEALAAGKIIVTGDEHTLLLDIDSERQYGVMLQQLGLMQIHAQLQIYSEWPSSTQYHRHVKIHTGRAYSVSERIAMQAMLGSDPMREFLTLQRHLVHGIPDPIRLFAPEGTVFPVEPTAPFWNTLDLVGFIG